MRDKRKRWGDKGTVQFVLLGLLDEQVRSRRAGKEGRGEKTKGEQKFAATGICTQDSSSHHLGRNQVGGK